MFRFIENIILVPEQWTDWRQWGSWTRSCGSGATRQRFRSFTPGRNGGKTEPDMPTTETETGEMFDWWPTPCPVPAKYGQWGNWDPCTMTCYYEGTQPSMIQRRKKCKPAILSNNSTIDANIATCEDLGDITERKTCPEDNKICPGEGRVQNIARIASAVQVTIPL